MESERLCVRSSERLSVFVQDGGCVSLCLPVCGTCVCVQSVSEEEEVPVEELSSEDEEELPLRRLAPPPEAPPPACFSREGRKEKDQVTPLL